jgi:hypothetical protein
LLRKFSDTGNSTSRGVLTELVYMVDTSFVEPLYMYRPYEQVAHELILVMQLSCPLMFFGAPALDLLSSGLGSLRMDCSNHNHT